MTTTTHNGKIARLPRDVKNELNHRLENGEPGGKIVTWLNSLPAVQSVLAAEFDGSPINAQNLTNWRKGGHQEWLKQQERRQLVRELVENAEELIADAGGVEIGNHLSAVLVAQFAASARDTLAAISDPAERAIREQECLLALARVRRQDFLAGKLALERERRAQERTAEQEKEKDRQEHVKKWSPTALLYRRSFMTDWYAKPYLFFQAMATQDAESLLRQVKLPPAGPAHSIAPADRQSN